MTYELAKQLKEAGFPQRFGSGYGFDEQGRTFQVVNNGYWEVKDTDISIPSLNELIKACGDEFGGLKHFPDEINNKFRAYNQPITLSTNADTPDMAVARLWLALKHKTDA
jgi:hypothetical protein